MADSVRVVSSPEGRRLVADSVDGFVGHICEEILADAERGVPRDTGALARSGDVLGVEDGVGRVGFGTPGEKTADYAAVVEGVAPKPAPAYPYQPYLRPALYRVREV